MSVLIFVDTSNGKIAKNSFEAVYYGKKVAEETGGGDVVALTYGNADDSILGELGKYGASKVLIKKGLESCDPQQLTRLVSGVAEEVGAQIVIFSHDHTGKSVAPRLSARLKAGYVPGAVGVPDTSNGFQLKVNVFSGKAFAYVQVKSDKKIISLLPNSMMPSADGDNCSVEETSVDAGNAGLTVTNVDKVKGDIPLPEAELVVSAGRGLKGPENWGIVEELAEELGAATACSRPVADTGWRPHHEHVGQTGVAIRPNLYIAAGISGAIQHLAGVNGSKVIVVINTDPEAPFFKAADYGIVGDAFEVLPKLTQAVKEFKADN